MTDSSTEIKDVNKKETKQPKRYTLYDRMNINEEYLDYFIVGTVILLAVVVLIGVI